MTRTRRVAMVRPARVSRPVSSSSEHYLRAILELRGERGYARVVDIATRVGVTKGTVSIALSQLRARGLIRYDAARFPVLTAAGQKVAADVRGRFAIVQTFLVDVLGLVPERASSEACRWEHVVSHEVADRLLDLLRFASESPRWEAALSEFQSFHRRCSAGSPCATCRARGPVESYCLEREPLVLPPRDSA